MSHPRIPRRLSRNGLATSRAIASAAINVVETLEPRQLLSATVTTFPIPGADASSWDGSTAHIVAGPDGSFWFTDPANAAIGKVTPAGAVTEYPLPIHNVPLDDGTGGSSPDDPEPSDIVVGPNGNFWFTETGVNRIGEITTAGVITEFKTPTADSEPQGIAVGADGNLWFQESNNDAIGRITPGGSIKEFSLKTLDVSYDDGIGEGSDGNIWFIADDNDGNGAIASITPGGTVTSYSLADEPNTLAAGPDGNLWVGTDDGTIDRVTTSGTITSFSLPDGAGVNSIRAGSDGNLWFTTDGNNQLGKISTAGVVSEFSLPGSTDASTTGPQPNDLVQAADGTLWYVDSYNPVIGHLDLTNALLASSTSVTVTAGAAATSTFGSFTDFSGASTADDYSATLTLSDNSTLPATIVANSNGGFDVTASNDWTIGYSSVTVTITDTRDASRVATATTSVDATAPTSTGTADNISTTAGQLFSGAVATFTGVALNSLSQYSASISWGDGHDTTGTITENSAGGFDIAGSNRYADAGTYSISVTLSPYGGGIAYPGGPIGIVPVTTPVKVPTPTTPIVTPITGVGMNGGATSTIGATGKTPTLTARSPIIRVPSNAASSSGVAIGAPGSTPIFFGGGGTSATGTATVAAGAMNGTGYSVQATSTAPFSGDVASFTLVDPSTDLSHLHATVVWNDPAIRDWFFTLSNSPADGVITANGNGGFTVSASASFATSGLYHFVVNITDDRIGAGDNAIVGVAHGQIVVDRPFRWLPIYMANAPTAATPAAGGANASLAGSVATNPALGEQVKPIGISPHTMASKTFTGSVGTLKGLSISSGSLSALTGTINWGDGTTSPATFAGGGKSVSVRGSHAYATPGKYAVSVDVTQSLIVNGQPSPLYPLHLPTIESAAKVSAAKATGHVAPITTGGIAITATAGTAFSGSVASFPAPTAAAGVSRTGTVAWGDGTHSPGVIAISDSNQIIVSGTHTYKKPGKHAVLVSVTQKGPPGAKVQRLLAQIKTSAKVT